MEFDSASQLHCQVSGQFSAQVSPVSWEHWCRWELLSCRLRSLCELCTDQHLLGRETDELCMCLFTVLLGWWHLVLCKPVRAPQGDSSQTHLQLSDRQCAFGLPDFCLNNTFKPSHLAFQNDYCSMHWAWNSSSKPCPIPSVLLRFPVQSCLFPNYCAYSARSKTMLTVWPEKEVGRKKRTPSNCFCHSPLITQCWGCWHNTNECWWQIRAFLEKNHTALCLVFLFASLVFSTTWYLCLK